MNIADYWAVGRDERLLELVNLSDQLAAQYTLRGGAQVDRERRYRKKFDDADPTTSVSARDQAAKAETMADNIYLIETNAQIEVLKVRIALLRDLLA